MQASKHACRHAYIHTKLHSKLCPSTTNLEGWLNVEEELLQVKLPLAVQVFELRNKHSVSAGKSSCSKQQAAGDRHS